MEYGLLVALLGAFLVTVITLLGTRLDALFVRLAGHLA
jgi:Flp pilus assembly pilin Flp